MIVKSIQYIEFVLKQRNSQIEKEIKRMNERKREMRRQTWSSLTVVVNGNDILNLIILNAHFTHFFFFPTRFVQFFLFINVLSKPNKIQCDKNSRQTETK